MKQHAETDLISTGKAEALVSHAEDLLTQVSTLAIQIQEKQNEVTRQASQEQHLTIPRSLANYVCASPSEEVRYH